MHLRAEMCGSKAQGSGVSDRAGGSAPMLPCKARLVMHHQTSLFT